jgi:hypothetical protein
MGALRRRRGEPEQRLRCNPSNHPTLIRVPQATVDGRRDRDGHYVYGRTLQREDATSGPVDLMERYRDKEGWFRCRCGQRGYIKKSFTTQEGPVWAPLLKGAIELGDKDDTYQPFVFLVGDQPDERRPSLVLVLQRHAAVGWAA